MNPAPTPIGRPSSAAWAASLALGLLGSAIAPAAPACSEGGYPAMSEPGRQPLLVFYFEALDRDGDLDTFRSRVEARYSEDTLRRLVAAGDVRARRAAVSALGLFGGFGSNAALAAALADDDPEVRELARKSLWSLWFRADTDENNARLRIAAELLGVGQLKEAHRVSSELISRAPDFAEAYNQRAIASFLLGNHAESAADCLRVLELNPYHIGALGGLGQSYLHLNQLDLALETYRRSLRLQPHDEGLKRLVAALESGRL